MLIILPKPMLLMVVFFMGLGWGTMVQASFKEKDVSTPSHVEIVNTQGQYALHVNGRPFTVKGAGINYDDGHNYAALVQAGGNAFRTWHTKYADIELAAAQEHNLMVAMGLDFEKELHGFDYNDKEAVAKQFDEIKAQVNRYKNHPNLLMWVIANEPNLLFDAQGNLALVNPKVYDALADIIDYIHRVDPHHPVTYSFAGVIKEHIDMALARTPNVDFVSVQVYGDLVDVSQRITKAGVTKPFMVTEYGPLGHWEVPLTAWGREIEEPSGVKARSMAQRIQQGLVNDTSGLNIGSFAFEWGQKQERTPTWYGLFNKDGSATARVDELTKYWTGKYPVNQAPQVEKITLQNQVPTDSVVVKPNEKLKAVVFATDPNHDSLDYHWTLLKEVKVKSQGGAFEQAPQSLVIKPLNNKASINKGELVFAAPLIEGEYRLFARIYDGKGKIGHANFPFLVQ